MPPTSAPPKSNHSWKFFRAGGFDQVRIDTSGDLQNIEFLDQKLWVALACPTRGVEFDYQTLDLIDTDKDGRIRAPEIIAAVNWICSVLKDPAIIIKNDGSLPLTAIQDSGEGKQLLASAKEILRNLGRESATHISVADTTDTTKIFSQTKFNGDGIIAANAASDAKIEAVIHDVIACSAPILDRSGKPGIDTKRLDAFFADLKAYSEWWRRSETESDILPLKGDTAAAYSIFSLVKIKVDDYFARCRLAAFDARALAALNRSETEYLTIAAKDMTLSASELAAFPIAKIEADRPLALLRGVNPAWADAIKTLSVAVIQPLLGSGDSLSESGWMAICKKLDPYKSWQAGKAGAAVEKLGIERIREILAMNCKDTIVELIARDQRLESEFNAIAAVDRLVRYHRDLYLLLINFVNFRDFYDGDVPAIFQAGTLYLDQRSCTLAVRVADPGKHASLASLSRSYLVYCDLTRKSSGDKMQIAAAVTNGDSDNLMIGRNGIFYDRHRNDWDATIIKIVEQPISIRQAFWYPYKKFAALVESQIEKFAASREKAVQDQAASGIDTVGKDVQAGKAAEKKEAFDVAKFAGIFAAIGLAVGALGTALATVAAGFLKLEMWQMPLAVAGMLLIISGPSMLLAWLKLRQRNLGPLLDANGWAVNSKAKVNIPFGRSLTGIAKLPPGSERSMVDPYAESHAARNWFIFTIITLVLGWALWNFGVVEKVAPEVFPKSSYVQKKIDAAEAKAKKEADEKAKKEVAPK
ncbi:MAG: hypothetical protein ACKVS6_02750 [Planctomycetota bacterium]